MSTSRSSRGFLLISLLLAALLLIGGTLVQKPVSSAPVPIALTALPLEGNLPEKKLLFVGNSYTFFNDMPVMVQNMLNRTAGRRYNYQTEMIVRDGATLTDHLNDQQVLARLSAAPYEYVFLQEQSTAVFYPHMAAASDAAIGGLVRYIKDHGARAVLLSTWPRQPGNGFYSSLNLLTPAHPKDAAEMTRRLNDFYKQAALKYAATHIPLAFYWYMALTKYPDLNMYTDDGSHPLPVGSYLMALLTYRQITGNLPPNLWHPPSVTEAERDRLVQLVSR